MRKFLFSVYILFFINPAFSQSAWKSFGQLSCPEKWWVITHPFVANKARKITADVRLVSNEMKKDQRLDGDASGGQVDAFRHAYWMAALSQKICWRKAISLGKAHEKGDYKGFKKGKADEENNLPDSVSGVMDLFNNGIGALIGKQNSGLDTDSLKNLIITQILQGKMKIISKNVDGKFLDCDGKFLEMKLYINVWGIPKCLVRSDVRRSK